MEERGNDTEYQFVTFFEHTLPTTNHLFNMYLIFVLLIPQKDYLSINTSLGNL